MPYIASCAEAYCEHRLNRILRSSHTRSSKKFAVSYGSGQPAVHADVLPRDVARVLGEEERRRLRDLRNRTPPAHRYRLSGLFVYLEALYVARQHVVHPDALCCVAVGVELREAGQGSAQGGLAAATRAPGDHLRRLLQPTKTAAMPASGLCLAAATSTQVLILTTAAIPKAGS